MRLKYFWVMFTPKLVKAADVEDAANRALKDYGDVEICEIEEDYYEDYSDDDN